MRVAAVLVALLAVGCTSVVNYHEAAGVIVGRHGEKTVGYEAYWVEVGRDTGSRPSEEAQNAAKVALDKCTGEVESQIGRTESREFVVALITQCMRDSGWKLGWISYLLIDDSGHLTRHCSRPRGIKCE